MDVVRLLVGVLCPPRHPMTFINSATRSRWRSGKREPRASELMLLARFAPHYENRLGPDAEELAERIGSHFRAIQSRDGVAAFDVEALRNLALACLYAAEALDDAYTRSELGVHDARQVDLEELLASRGGPD